MTVLQTIGKYEIISEKVDECPPNWADSAIVYAFLGGIIIVCGFMGWSLFYFDLNSAFHSDVIGVVIALSGGGLSILFFALIRHIALQHVKCGVKITLKKIDSTWGEKGEVLSAVTYQFTNDSLKDAEKIKTIVSAFVIKANQLIGKYKVGDEKREQCCNQYKVTMQKVKLD
jgi:hypothetical protein